MEEGHGSRSGLTPRPGRFAAALACSICLVAPGLVGCGGGSADNIVNRGDAFADPGPGYAWSGTLQRGGQAVPVQAVYGQGGLTLLEFDPQTGAYAGCWYPTRNSLTPGYGDYSGVGLFSREEGPMDYTVRGRFGPAAKNFQGSVTRSGVEMPLTLTWMPPDSGGHVAALAGHWDIRSPSGSVLPLEVDAAGGVRTTSQGCTVAGSVVAGPSDPPRAGLPVLLRSEASSCGADVTFPGVMVSSVTATGQRRLTLCAVAVQISAGIQGSAQR